MSPLPSQIDEQLFLADDNTADRKAALNRGDAAQGGGLDCREIVGRGCMGAIVGEDQRARGRARNDRDSHRRDDHQRTPFKAPSRPLPSKRKNCSRSSTNL